MPDYNLSKLTVLVVEQHGSMRRMIRDILKEFGVSRVLEASDEKTAFDIFQEFPADLVLTDWSPNLDGVSFLDKIRNYAESRDIFVPVVLVTAFTDLQKVCEARDAGMNEFLAKPFTASLVYARIKSLIENPRQFVKADSYFGPDRRRRGLDYRGRDRRLDIPSSLPGISDSRTTDNDRNIRRF